MYCLYDHHVFRSATRRDGVFQVHSGRVSVSIFKHLVGPSWRLSNICVRRLRRFQHSPASPSSPASQPAFSEHASTLKNALYKWFLYCSYFHPLVCCMSILPFRNQFNSFIQLFIQHLFKEISQRYWRYSCTIKKNSFDYGMYQKVSQGGGRMQEVGHSIPPGKHTKSVTNQS